MIETTVAREEQIEKRLALRSAAETFINVVSEGTSCSRFEAQVISVKAQEVFQLGPYGDRSRPEPGQMVWRAIEASEPAGKPLPECKFKDVVLTLHRLDEDRNTRAVHGASAARGQQMARICEEAYEQGALLTQEDLATLLDCDVRTVRNDQKLFQSAYGVLVATRGNKCDIGPGVTHREKALELFIEGHEAQDIALRLKHSLKAVERYIDSYCRIVYCQRQVRDSLKTAMVVGVSVSLVGRCLEIHERHMRSHAYRDVLEQVERSGSAFWDCQGSKKKLGQTSGRQQ